MRWRTSSTLSRRAGQTLRPIKQIAMTHTLAISLLLAPFLVACSSPPKQTSPKEKYAVDYTVGSKVQLSGVAAEAAVKDTYSKSKGASNTPLDKEMRLLRAPMPRMPDQAIRAGLSDHVIVDILFNEAGEVESVVPKSYEYPVLLEAVLSVARAWKIDPPVEAGRRVKTTVRQSFRFEVQ
jgi:TonB family protein